MINMEKCCVGDYDNRSNVSDDDDRVDKGREKMKVKGKEKRREKSKERKDKQEERRK